MSPRTLLDEIDRVPAKHYGFTDEELDFIINKREETLNKAMGLLRALQIAETQL